MEESEMKKKDFITLITEAFCGSTGPHPAWLYFSCSCQETADVLK